MTRPRVLLAEPLDFSESARTILEGVASVDVGPVDARGLRAAFQSHDAIWIRLGHRIDAACIGSSPRCRVLAVPTTGLDHIDLEACRAASIRVLSLRGEVEFLKTIRATAELTLGLLLALNRRLPGALASVLDGAWDRDSFRGQELYGRTAGVVGLGRLGTIVASYLAALGMRVLGVDPRADYPSNIAQRMPSLDALLEESDVVSLHVDYSPTTHHLLSAPQFARMKPGSVLINTARGGVVDSAALLEALEGGRLAGAALDVVEDEPIKNGDHPLVRYARQHSNLLIVPHIGGNTYQSFERTEVFIAERLATALQELT